ncbi:MAG: tetratricopeptide repeat protein [Bacteroidia bacterium]
MNYDFGAQIQMVNRTKIHIWCLLSFFLLFSLPKISQGQEEILELRNQLQQAKGDERHKLLISLAKAYYQVSVDSAIDIMTKLLASESEQLDTELRADAHSVLSNAFQLRGRYGDALAEARKAQDIYELINDSAGISSVLSNVGTIYYYRTNYQLALDYYMRAMRYKEALKQENAVAGLQCNIGNIYMYQRQFEQARIHYEEAQKAFTRLDNQRGISYTYNNLGVIYEETGELEKAISSYLQAYEIDEQLGDKLGMSSAYHNLGEIYKKTNRFSLAREHYNRALELAQEMAHPSSIIRTLNGLAALELIRPNFNAAITYAKEALEMARASKTIIGQRSSLEVLTDAYERLGQPQRSLDYMRMLMAVKDSSEAEERRMLLAETQSRYEVERRDQELQLMKKDKSLQESRLTRQELLNKIYIAAIGMVVLLLFFIINRYQLIRNTEEKLRQLNASLEEKVNDRTSDLRNAYEKAERADKLKAFFLANINHELRTPMNGIIGMTEYLQENVQQDDLKQVADNLAASSRRLAETLAAIIELSNTESTAAFTKIETINPETHVQHLIKNFEAELKAKELRFEIVNYTGGFEIETNAILLDRILKNLIQNAVKFTDSGSIKIEMLREIMQNKPAYSIRILDTGIGIPEESLREIFEAFRTGDNQMNRGYEGLGIGLTLARKYAEMLGGNISVDSRVGQGSVFTLRLPILS